MGLREKRKARFRERILEAALDVFSERGYHDAQVSDIAAQAEVAVGTVYNLFNNKEDLYRALLSESAGEIASVYSEIFDQDIDPLYRLQALIRVKGDLLEDSFKVVRLFFNQEASRRIHVRASLSEDIQRLYDTLLGQLAEIFQAAITAGYISDDLDPVELAVALDSVTNSFAFLAMDHPEKHPYPSKVERIERMFFGSIMTDKGMRIISKSEDKV